MKKDTYDSVSARIKIERKRLSLTQAEAASLCEVTRVQWGRYERGESEFGGRVLKAFIAIGADGAYILGGVRADDVQLAQAKKMIGMAKAFDGTPMEKQMREFVNSALEIQTEEAVRIGAIREKRKSRYDQDSS